MRRSAVSFAVIAILLAPLHALGAAGLGCEGARATSSCCCPTTAQDSPERDGDEAPRVESTCCCEVQPVSQTSPVPPAGMTQGAPIVSDAATAEAGAPAALPTRRATFATSARGPPLPARSLLDQQIALLL